MSNKCPKCGAKFSPFYLKQNCPKCGVDLLYYKLEERLEADAAESERQVLKLKHFTDTVKSSSVASPILIIRLILFFTPLGWMCLPMYGGLTLVSVIIGIIKGELDMSENLLPVLSIAMVILLSLAVIISSLFSATKHGLVRNLIFSGVNTAVLLGFAAVIGSTGIGWYITFAVYVIEIILHFVCDRAISAKRQAE